MSRDVVFRAKNVENVEKPPFVAVCRTDGNPRDSETAREEESRRQDVGRIARARKSPDDRRQPEASYLRVRVNRARV